MRKTKDVKNISAPPGKPEGNLNLASRITLGGKTGQSETLVSESVPAPKSVTSA